MTTQELAREKVLIDIISERDALILALATEKDKLMQENESLRRQLDARKEGK